jgi:hypothetical protein
MTPAFALYYSQSVPLATVVSSSMCQADQVVASEHASVIERETHGPIDAEKPE